jgi:Alkylmercury lyase
MASFPLDKISLHYVILRHLMEHCYAPTCDALEKFFGVQNQEIGSAMLALQEYHGVVLHPHCPEVWVIHPFSTAPTCFTVRYGERSWWAPCAWCSLGIAALLGGNGVSIESSLGADGAPVTVHVDGGCVQEDLLVHFPIPMTRIWDNVIYGDSTILFFESDNQIGAWAKRRHIGRGDSQPVQRVYELGAAWYGHHLDEHWHKWTLDEARAIFTGLGLKGPIWELPHSGERF